MLNSPHDHFFKKVFSQKEIARDFIENYLPKELTKIINTKELKIVKDSFIDKELKNSFSDMVYKVDIHNNPGYLYLLFEHKSYPDKLVSFQLLKYLTKIWDLHLKQNNTNKLPFILPLVVYHGREKYNISLKFSSLLAKEKVLKEYIPDFKYLLYDFSQYSHTEIIGSVQSRLFLKIIQNIFKDDFEKELDEIFSLFRELNDTNTVLEYFETAMRYIINIREISIQNLKTKVNKTIPERSGDLMSLGEKLRKEGRKEGRIEGLKEGKLENLRETISIQLTKKLNINKMPDQISQKINSANIEELEKIRDNIFEIDSLDEVKKYLN